MRIKFLLKISGLCLLILACVSIAHAQVKKITGKVLEKSTGLAMPGVTITVKGKSTVTAANPDGTYSISADPTKDVLVFSFIGFKKQEVPIQGKMNISVSMEDDKSDLDEVVVVGYGAKRKSEVIGAVSTIKAEEIADVPAPDIAAALRNRIAGVGVSVQSGAPGATITLNIRGASISPNAGSGATAEPLYVIDGITSTSDQFEMLDPTMVEDITILKDASAAIYGASGSKGVVLVTTKKGKIGKPKLSYSGYYGVNDATRKPEMMDGYQLGLAYNQSLDQQGFANGNKYFTNSDLQYLKDHPVKSWFDEVWRASIQQKHSVTLSGGSDKMTFFIGGGVQNDGGNYIGTYYNRKFSFRSGLTMTFSDALKADVNFNVSYNKKYSDIDVTPGDQNFMTALITVPQWVPIQINGNPVYYLGGTNGTTTIKNPLAQINSGFYNLNQAYSYTLNTALTYTPKAVPGLALRFQIGQTGNWGGSEKYTAPYNSAVFKMTGSNALFYTDTITSYKAGIAQTDARLANSYSKGTSYQANITLNYARSFGKHSVSALVGGEQSASNSDGQSVMWQNQLVANQTDYWAFDQTQFTNQGRTKAEAIKQSFFGRVSYDYQKKYLIDAVGRFDASSNFATGHAWGFFPNVGVAWNISEEPFFKNSKVLSFVSYLKLKSNVGLTGDDRTLARLWQAKYNVDLVNTGYLFGSGNASQGTLNPSQIPNPDITWQKKRTVDVGLESSFFNNRLTFGFDYFHDYIYDEFDKNIDQSFPMYAGFVAPTINHEEHHTYGTEFSIGYNDRITKDLRFNTSVNFGFSSTYISQVYLAAAKLWSNTNGDWQYALGTNQKVWNSGNIGLISQGMLKTQADVDRLLKQYPNYTIYGATPEAGFLYYKDENGDGKIDDSDMIPMFSKGTDPIINLGLNFGFDYKGFQLRTNMVANIGGKVFYDSKALAKPTQYQNVPKFWDNRWSPTNPDGLFPRIDDPGAGKTSTFWARDATMIRINNMSLSYGLPATLLQRTGFSSLRIVLSGYNLWTLVNPLGYKDPYSSYIYDYPTIRTVSVGLNFGL
ncbi:TonB-linked SusC/RagA family outer membrane protein [Mucilaginibacter yixingensis]|uniref:TonB-linked SusC/RagA family outer membrane protein n=1 Tax=Mucilaginibacter yixingensis TaxID=1295612 RepID=A0A2T5JB82_9SPHI|nr:TonB-dependent receptor [Mucilaginibacter yixingensis]PTQ98120.1 TonB-linked SusC/RagA family outer membrane protein [Mucilaginibacter yixingensis]